MTDLSGAGVRVLLIGTATHHGDALPSVPSVARTFEDLRTVLLERCNVREDRLSVLLDPADAQTMAAVVTEAAQAAETVLLVYFVGHGLLGPGGELYLAASATDRLVPGMAEHQALSFASLRQALTASRASSLVVVLDCCFSGRVSLQGPSMPVFSAAPAHGLHLIGSAEQLALAPKDAVHTAFSGELIRLLTDGDPQGPHLLTLDDVYDHLFRVMRDKRRPLPRRLTGDRSGGLVVARNPAVAVRPEPSPSSEPASTRCPYPGLAAFGTDDADVFYGRKRMTDRVLAAVAEAADDPEGSGPLVLVGPSGSGKSSILNAGLLAGVRSGALQGLPGSASWPCIVLTPGESPLRRLAEQLDPTTHDAAELLRQDPGRAAELAGLLLSDNPGHRLIVLVDQLEELFALCPDPDEHAAFLRALTAIAGPRDGGPPPGLMVLALRADFYGQAAAHPELLDALRDRQLLVEPMDREELRAAIERPAEAAGLILDDGLADMMLHELGATDGGNPATGALPLLSHALWSTWRQRAGTRLTMAGYRNSGGIAQAIVTTADDAYKALDEAGRKALRRMLPRLVRIGEDSADTAQPVERSVLLHGLPDVPAAQRAIDQLTRDRLLTLDRDTVRVSHEALLRAWPRLREWVDADRSWLAARQQLVDDAGAWERSGRDTSLLYRGSRLVAVLERIDNTPSGEADLDPGARDFLDRSRWLQRRGKRRRRLTTTFLIALAILTSAGLTGSTIFQQRAEDAQNRDAARYLAAEARNLRENQPGLAKQLGLLSYRIDPAVGRGAVLTSGRGPGVVNDGEEANDLVQSANGRVLAIIADTAVILRGRDGVPGSRISGWRPGPSAIDPAGSLLVAATYASDSPQVLTPVLRLWDLADLGDPREVAAVSVGPAVTALAVSTDGRTIFAGTVTGEILRWDIGDRAAPRALPAFQAHTARIDSLAVAPDGGRLASASIDGKVQLWDTGAPSSPVLLSVLGPVEELDVESDLLKGRHRVAFDPTGRLLATPSKPGSKDGPSLWNLDDPNNPRLGVAGETTSPGRQRRYCGQFIRSLAFSPVGQRLVESCDGSRQIWTYTTDPGSTVLAAGGSFRSSGPGAALFDTADSTRLLDATERGVRIWDLANADEVGAESFLPTKGPDGKETVWSLDYRSAGPRRLIALQGPRSTALWDVTDTAQPKRLTSTPTPFPHGQRTLALSPDGALLATLEASADRLGALSLRSTSALDGPPLATIPNSATGVLDLAFSPTKPILAVADGAYPPRNGSPPPQSTVRLYDIADPRRPVQIAQLPVDVSSMAFSPDGETLTVVESLERERRDAWYLMTVTRQLRTWDVRDPARPAELWTHPFPVSSGNSSFAYRPDGGLFVTGDNGAMRIWRVADHRLVGEPLVVTTGPFGGDAVTFSPDGTRLALSTIDNQSSDSRPEIWDMTDPGAPVRQSDLPSGGILDFNSFAFSPDGSHLAVARDDGVALWDIDPERIAARLCRSAGDPITPQQWKQYLPDRPYQPPCR